MTMLPASFAKKHLQEKNKEDAFYVPDFVTGKKP